MAFVFSGLIWVCNGLHGTIEDVVLLWEYNQPEGIWEYELAGIEILLNNMSKDDPWMMFGSVDGLHSKKTTYHIYNMYSNSVGIAYVYENLTSKL